jgi:hypothetical protein
MDSVQHSVITLLKKNTPARIAEAALAHKRKDKAEAA